MTYVIIKSHKKTRTSPSLRKIHFSNIYRGVKLTHSLFRVKTASKRAIQKAAEATGDLISNKSINKITKNL